MTLPTDYAERKNFPLLTVLTAYFPDAIEALVELCKQGNVQHAVDDNAVNPFKLDGDRITWDRSKSKEQTETAMRHLWDHERIKRTHGGGYPVDTDGHLHIIKTAWRALAEAQLTIERIREEEAMSALVDGCYPDTEKSAAEHQAFYMGGNNRGEQPSSAKRNQAVPEFGPSPDKVILDTINTGHGAVRLTFEDGVMRFEPLDPLDVLNDKLAEAAAEDRVESPDARDNTVDVLVHEEGVYLRFNSGNTICQLPLKGLPGEPAVGDTLNFPCKCHQGDYEIVAIEGGYPLIKSPDGDQYALVTENGVYPSEIRPL